MCFRRPSSGSSSCLVRVSTIRSSSFTSSTNAIDGSAAFGDNSNRRSVACKVLGTCDNLFSNRSAFSDCSWAISSLSIASRKYCKTLSRRPPVSSWSASTILIRFCKAAIVSPSGFEFCWANVAWDHSPTNIAQTRIIRQPIIASLHFRKNNSPRWASSR